MTSADGPPSTEEVPVNQPAADDHTDLSRAKGVQVGDRNTQNNAFTNVNVLNRIEHATVLPPDSFVPMAELPAPAGLANPPVRHRRFVGRVEMLSWLDDIDAGTARVVYGLGGCGKTTLVAHWLSLCAEKYNPIWWITADSSDGLDRGLASLITAVTAAVHPALAVGLPVDVQRERAVQWLRENHGWLLVLDSVNDPELVAPLLNRLPAGRFVITSRRAFGWDDFAIARQLDVLPPEDAVEMATKALPPGRRVDVDGIAAICTELGQLPLAVEQAAAFMAETGTDAQEYLELLAEYPAHMYRSGGAGWSPERTIARVWAVTLKHLASDSLTIMVLRVLAWFAPSRIPSELLDGLGTRPAVLQAIQLLGAHSMIGIDDSTLDVHQLVQAVVRTPDLATDEDDELSSINQARSFAAAALRRALEDDPEDDPATWPAWSTISRHAMAYLDRTDASQDGSDAEFMAYEVSRFLRSQGLYGSALSLAQRAADAACRLYGNETLCVTARLSNLAEAKLATGDPGEGLALHERVLALRAAMLEERHPLVLDALDRLAHAHLAVGDAARAVQMHERVLADIEQALGPQARHTLIAANDLVHAMLQHDAVRGRPLAETVLERCERAVGYDDPQTLTARHNVASAYAISKEWKTAIPLLEQVIDDSARTLGTKHPDTLQSRNTLAISYLQRGMPQQAVPILEWIVATTDEVMGQHSRLSILFRCNLGSAYLVLNDFGRAIDIRAEVLAALANPQWAKHADTRLAVAALAGAFISEGADDNAIALLLQVTAADQAAGQGASWSHHRELLADCYLKVGRPSAALRLYDTCLLDEIRTHGHGATPRGIRLRCGLGAATLLNGNPAAGIANLRKALTDALEILGPSDPNTHAATQGLAYAYHSIGDLDAAILVLRHALAACERSLGATHPETTQFRQLLAYEQVESGDAAPAIPVYEEILRDHLRIHGSEHVKTLNALFNLGYACWRAKETSRAVELLERALHDHARVLGTDDPETLTVRNQLAAAYAQAGQTDQARELYREVLAQREQLIGNDQPPTLVTLHDFGQMMAAAGQLDEAAELIARSLAGREAALGATHPLTQASRYLLASIAERQGDFERAASLYLGNLNIVAQTLGDSHPTTVDLRHCLGRVLSR